MKTLKTLISLLAVVLLIVWAVLNLRYGKLNEPAQYKGQSAVQRIDRLKRTTEVFYESEWISTDAWKDRIDALANDKGSQPAWQTPSLSPFDGKTKPVLEVHRGKADKRSPVQQVREVQKYHQDITNKNQE
jgi:hypothetical protein